MKEEMPDQGNSPEDLPEISPEELQEMLGQIPALKEMLEERKNELRVLEDSENPDRERVNVLREEISELETEIEGREEAGL